MEVMPVKVSRLPSSDEVQEGESEKSTAARFLRNKQHHGGGHREEPEGSIKHPSLH